MLPTLAIITFEKQKTKFCPWDFCEFFQIKLIPKCTKKIQNLYHIKVKIGHIRLCVYQNTKPQYTSLFVELHIYKIAKTLE